MSRLLFDTCFLIDLERELPRGSGPAHDFLRAHPEAEAFISWTVAGEFAEGFENIDAPACAAMLDQFEVLPCDRLVAGVYARITRELRARGQLIGTNDLWIAAASLAWNCPLVSRNARHFAPIPGLTLATYGSGDR